MQRRRLGDDFIVVDDDDEVRFTGRVTSTTPACIQRDFRIPSPGGDRATTTDVKGTPSPKTSPSQPSVSTSPKDPLGDLSAEQRMAFHTVVNLGRSVFITGGAGTGKSFLLQTIIAALPRHSTFVTASTGIAALNLNGTTLHRFAGCGIVSPTDDKSIILAKVLKSRRSMRNWLSCRVLVIDEISMIESFFFELVDYIARHARRRPEEPFGGVQLVLAGDFLQLPPVTKQRDCMAGSAYSHEKIFSFLCGAWMRANPKVCLLSLPFRQRKAHFYHMLNEVRMAEISPETDAFFRQMSFTNSVNFVKTLDTAQVESGMLVALTPNSTEDNRLVFANALGEPLPREFDGRTILRATNLEVDAENRRFFDRLRTDIYTYNAHESITNRGAGLSKAVQPMVQLRVGCRVMLIKNIDFCSGLVNGSTGTVKDFVTFGGDYVLKSTGSTLHDVRQVCGPHRQLPLVEFDMRSSDGTVSATQIVVEPQEWKEMQGEECMYRVVQIPLVLGYAITIHKSQGMTLTKVDIDMTSSFERGQVYVALSRCTDVTNLQLHGFSSDKVMAHRDAVAYYRALEKCRVDHAWRCLRGMPTEEDRLTLSSMPPQCYTPYGYNVDDNGDNEEGGVSGEEYCLDATGRIVRSEVSDVPARESVFLEACRRDVLVLEAKAAQVKDMLRKAVRPAHTVHNSRLVMDLSSLYHLVVGEDSVDLYDRVFLQNGNMMRVPMVVMNLLVRAADYEPCGPTKGNSTSPTSGVGGEAQATNDDAQHDSEEEGSRVAAEVLTLMVRAKDDFVFDVQKPTEHRPLSEPLSMWRPFAPVLPLLQSSSWTSSSRWAAHYLNRHLDESDDDHAHLLQYAAYLRDTYGGSAVVCTDSPKLAAYGVAYGFPVVSVAYLQRMS